MVKLLTFIFLGIFISGCLPTQTPVAPKREITEDATDNGTPSDNQINQTAFWLDSGIAFQNLVVDSSNLKTVFIFGDDVNQYLNASTNAQDNFCLHIDFQPGAGTTPKQLRVRAIPSFQFDPATGLVTRFFRINTNTPSGNEACGLITREENIDTFPIFSQITYDISEVCTNCINLISSTSVKLYQEANGKLEIIEDEVIKISPLTLRIDVNSNSGNNQQSCTNTQCANLGFDCCINGQCVNDAQLKFTRSEVVERFSTQILNEYDLAVSLIEGNSSLYINYPQFYYVCLEDVPTDTTGSPDEDDTDTTTEAQERLNENIRDFFCIEELRENSELDPFHSDPINASHTYRVCTLSSDPSSSHSMYFRDVMMRMYSQCGCSETTFSNMVANCPRYTYKAISNNEANDFGLSNILTYMTDNNLTDLSSITSLESVTDFQSIECVAPEVDPNDLPFQNLEVLVPTRSAPHRFFDQNTNNGESIEINDFSNLPTGAAGVQEGVEFQYLDDEKIFPLNGSFNMNSILGQLNVNLSGALPAKVIDIEFDKEYYIATIQGFYTPCPSCAKDSWFPSFSSMPITNFGVGLTSLGFTTRRDRFGSNQTLGNYEDTIFGRACWVPPTMLPFSHNPNGDVQTQRLNRLQTQAAMYANGYQRDWFGFNKGALIGSFDGVSWFAIGKGRVATSTSNKLYLAINAPFADLAQPNDHIVSVQEWDFITTGARYDYDISESINSAFQNEAGQCQRSHRCETDSDCITQLGWEYTCADINNYKTAWPKFTTEGAREIASDQRVGGILEFLNQGSLPPGTSSRKCVYRGAGAPCRRNYENLATEELRKSFSCAPNFYCASLSDTQVFNSEVSRFATALENIAEPNNHLFGQDANILGRPRRYLATSANSLTGLPLQAQSSIAANFLNSDPTSAGDVGLCRPGKRLPASNGGTSVVNSQPAAQHLGRDTEARVDFISQIAGCNSSYYDRFKTSSCPIMDIDGNYRQFKNEFLQASTNDQENNIVNLSSTQNACGLEAIDSTYTITPISSADDLRDNSAFNTIEARPLSTSDVTIEPTLARDACFRRAGSVCHTDLDCSPNYKHAEVVDILDPRFFGNDAEKAYWTEDLVCGQGADEPLSPTAFNFNTYNINNNRCCREVGKSITLFTEKDPRYKNSDGTFSVEFNAKKSAAYFPNDTERYSRYSILESGLNSTTNESFDDTTSSDKYVIPNASIPAGNPSLPGYSTLRTILDGKQWRTISDSAQRTCCGGAWIRKFADGTNNWQNNDRLNIDVNNFKCLNFRSPLVNTDTPEKYGVTNSENSQDSQNSCLDNSLASSGCSQFTGDEWGGIQINTLDDQIDKPIPHTQLLRLNEIHSDFTQMVDSFSWASNPWSLSPLFSTNGGSQNEGTIEFDRGFTDTSPAPRRHISIRLPSFVTWPDRSVTEVLNTATKVELIMEDLSGDNTFNTQCLEITDQTVIDDVFANQLNTPFSPATTSSFNACDSAANDCCVIYQSSTRTLKVSYKDNISGTAGAYSDTAKSFYLRFMSPGMAVWEKDIIDNYSPAGSNSLSNPDLPNQTLGNLLDHRRSSEPGNPTYYLKKLTKLELLGIPQIIYEPLYCNDNYQKVVPGIFKEEIKSIIDFNNHPDTFLAPSSLDEGTEERKPYEQAPANIVGTALDYTDLNQPYVSTDQLIEHEPIFSSNEFMCCKPLGTLIDTNVDNGSSCCSGFAATQGNSSSSGGFASCMLAPGTDLNVYFNRFVSNEGSGDDIDNPLTEADFDQRTGAPLLKSSVRSKLQTLAQTYCISQNYVSGGAFGNFASQPNGNLGVSVNNQPQLSIVDSIFDNGSNNNDPAGFNTFNNGYRWNTHIYCAD